MGTALLALCFCALSLVLALFVGISPISDKAKLWFMYVGATLSLMAAPMMGHYISGLNDIVDELRYQAVLVFIVVVCCYCFVMANMVKCDVMKKKVGVLVQQRRVKAINACAIAFAEREQIVIPKVNIAVNAKCSQADLMVMPVPLSSRLARNIRI